MGEQDGFGEAAVELGAQLLAEGREVGGDCGASVRGAKGQLPGLTASSGHELAIDVDDFEFAIAGCGWGISDASCMLRRTRLCGDRRLSYQRPSSALL